MYNLCDAATMESGLFDNLFVEKKLTPLFHASVLY